jgi:hypothetical protein
VIAGDLIPTYGTELIDAYAFFRIRWFRMMMMMMEVGRKGNCEMSTRVEGC